MAWVAFVIAENVMTENKIPEHQEVVDNNYAAEICSYFHNFFS